MTASQDNHPDARMRVEPTQFVFALLFAALSGCVGQQDPKSFEIRGTVATSKDLSDSFLGPPSPGTEDQRVAGATIILAFDEGGTQQVKGCYAESEKDGSYQIKAEKVPASPTKYGNDYYLIVKKEGFAPLAQQISVGPFSQDSRNTVWLKPVVK